MSVANFIKKRFLNKRICIYLNNTDMETLIYSESWSVNKEFLDGIVKEVEEGVIVIECEGNNIYVNEDEVSYFWEPPFNPEKVMKTSLGKAKKA